MVPYQVPADEVLRDLSVALDQGLSDSEARQRLEKHGRNELVDAGIKSPWRILLEQLSSTLVLLLIGAAIVSAALNDWEDAIAILTIVTLNALLGLRQEYKAEQAMAALKKLAVPHVHVRRDGEVKELDATELTIGDLVLLEAGNSVPADGRLVECASLRVQEAALTGESEPDEKDATVTLPADAPLGDRVNMVYMGTAATYGRGMMVVTAIGMQTELGHIATMIQNVGGDPTPLQKRLDHLGRRLAVVAQALVSMIFFLGWYRGEMNQPNGFRTLLLTAVSLAVAAVPEGLSAVVTIALALGAQRMLKRHALIRKLPAVETLGSVTVICSDKTGTLTENQMTVTALDVAGKYVAVEESTDDAGQQQFQLTDEEVVEVREHPSLALLLAGANLCNDAVVQHHPTPEDKHGEKVVGDPTEGALVLAGHRLGVDKEDWERVLPRVDELPFDSERKRMSTVHALRREGASKDTLLELLPQKALDGSSHFIFAKGALDSLLTVSQEVWADGQRQPLDDAHRSKIQEEHDRLAGQGMRVFGVAFRSVGAAPEKKDWEREMTFVGLVGMHDPPRPEALEAIAHCRTAGIRVMMITGDHPLTATSIADKLGLDTSHGAITGQELDKTPKEKLPDLVRERSIYARVSPEHKLRLVEALRAQGEIVAMTGDGVNDAPALKQADIGVAMGITGTDVSKEAADMVLRDDNFATIVAAVEEGRVIFDNVRKFIRYLLCTNAGEIWVMLLGPLAGMPLPLLPLQILWMNLATDGFPALALGVEPAERDIMQRPPRKVSDSIFAGGVGVDILWIGLLMAGLSLGVGYWSWSADPEGPWRTLVFTTMTLCQLSHALAVRSEHGNFWQVNWFSNKALLLAVGSMFAAQMAITYIPVFQGIFETESLSARHLLLCLGLASVVFVAVEIEKLIVKSTKSQAPNPKEARNPNIEIRNKDE